MPKLLGILGISLPYDLVEQLDIARKDISRSRYIRRLVEAALEESPSPEVLGLRPNQFRVLLPGGRPFAKGTSGLRPRSSDGFLGKHGRCRFAWVKA